MLKNEFERGASFHYGRGIMKPALTRNSNADMYKGNEVEIASRAPVAMGTVIPAKRESAEAIPVALPLYATENRRGVYP